MHWSMDRKTMVDLFYGYLPEIGGLDTMITGVYKLSDHDFLFSEHDIIC